MASAIQEDDKNKDAKLPAKPPVATTTGGGSLARMPSITAASGPTWFRSLDWFKSTDSATGILRDEVFKSDVSFDIAVLEAATASADGHVSSSSFPPPLPRVVAGGRNQSTTSTSSQDSWLRKMLTTTTHPAPASAAGPALLARNTSTSSQQSSSSSSIMQKVYDVSKSALAKLCTSGDWAPPDLTQLHEPLVNVADIFKTSNEYNNTKTLLPFATTVADSAAAESSASVDFQPRPHEELAAARKMANIAAIVGGSRHDWTAKSDFINPFEDDAASTLKNCRPRHARATAAAVTARSRTATSTSNCMADFMKEMQAACAPATAAAINTAALPPASGIGSAVSPETSNTTRLKDPPMPPITVSSSGTAVWEQQENKQPPSRKRKQSGDDDIVYVEPTDKDVLMGRGGRTNNHPGNKEYLKAKDAMQKRYMEASKQDKTPISQELVDQVHAWGGRFLQLADGKNTMQNSNQWYEVDPVTARKKCSQTLREINTPEVRRAKRSKYSRA